MEGVAKPLGCEAKTSRSGLDQDLTHDDAECLGTRLTLERERKEEAGESSGQNDEAERIDSDAKVENLATPDTVPRALVG